MYRATATRSEEGVYRGTVYDTGSIPRRCLMVVAEEAQCDLIVDTLLKAASTNEVGDGKVFVSSVESATRVRDGQKGPAAL